ncbi:hypothetical protein Btru_060873 [Bulinus truncatus]|nr:hypothetical protein Btru_060873 [Bulinus truncatus]
MDRKDLITAEIPGSICCPGESLTRQFQAIYWRKMAPGDNSECTLLADVGVKKKEKKHTEQTTGRSEGVELQVELQDELHVELQDKIQVELQAELRVEL